MLRSPRALHRHPTPPYVAAGHEMVVYSAAAAAAAAGAHPAPLARQSRACRQSAAAAAAAYLDFQSAGVVVEEVEGGGDDDLHDMWHQIEVAEGEEALPAVPDTSVGEAVPAFFTRPGSPLIEVVSTSPEWSAHHYAGAAGGGVVVEELDEGEEEEGGEGATQSGADWLEAAVRGGGFDTAADSDFAFAVDGDGDVEME